jgi:hypothetical protein
MESTSPERPEPRPIDWTSLTDAQKRSFQETVDQDREEDIARRRSMPTRLLGWMLIGGFCLELAGGFTGNHADLGGLLFLFAGIGVLKGSQSWLRFATLMAVLASSVGFLIITWSVAMNQPIEIDRGWVDYRQLSFWTLGVSPLMFLMAESILGAVAFRQRRIHFWTKTVRIFAGILAGILLIQGVKEVFKWRGESILKRTLSNEIETTRQLMIRHGSGFSASSSHDWQSGFEPLTKVRRINWMSSPNVTMQVYDRKSRIGRSRSTYRIEHYSEWLRLPSGEWGKLELEVILPQAP